MIAQFGFEFGHEPELYNDSNKIAMIAQSGVDHESILYNVIQTITTSDLKEDDPNLPFIKNSFHNLTKNEHEIVMSLKQNHDNINKIMYIIVTNSNITFHVPLHIPFSQFINIYSTYAFLKSHIDSQYLAKILDNATKRIHLNYINNKSIMNDIINVTNQLNLQYNFTTDVLQRRYNSIKDIFDFFEESEIDKLILGRNLLLILANKKFSRDKLVNTALTVYLTDKNKISIDTTKINKLSITDIGYLHVEKDGIKILVSTVNSDKDKKSVLINEGCIYDLTVDGCVLFTPIIYQTLDKQHLYTETSYTVTKTVVLDQPQISINLKNYPRLHIEKDNLYNRCYVCKEYFDSNYFYGRYKGMCIACGIFNYQQKIKMADLRHIKALVTGVRHKIGFQTVIKLLRCGATVIGSTRYPYAAWYNYSKETDFETWKHRLILLQCDFTKSDQVKSLINYVKTMNISVLINNACQTARPSKEYVEQLLNFEDMLAYSITDSSSDNTDNTDNKIIALTPSTMITLSPNSVDNYNNILVNYPIWPLEALEKASSFKLNKFGDIVEYMTRDKTSWTKTLDDIDTGEILEVNVINQIVPTLLINQIKPTMSTPAFIINVTALEGQFDNKKTGTHPHTNMCKAAMNMLIKTMAESKHKNNKGFHYFAIDPGFVSGVNSKTKSDLTSIEYPLSARDGASRILDPVITFGEVNYDTSYPQGVNKYKNYLPCPW